MSRLDLLKKGAKNIKDTSNNPRENLLEEEGGKTVQRKKELDEQVIYIEEDSLDDDIINDEDIYHSEEDNDKIDVNVIELDIGKVDRKKSFTDEDDKHALDYGLDLGYDIIDIKVEVDYVFEGREELHYKYYKAIKGGGLEIFTTKKLELDDIVGITVTLVELKEQVSCEGRVISVYPLGIRETGQYRYIVQLVGPDAVEANKALAKYLLGFKID